MPSEYVLRLRIEQAVKDAEQANKNHDALAYDRARARYELANKWLTELENKRNEKVLLELETQVNAEGVLPWKKIFRSGVPADKLMERGWQNTTAGMRKAPTDGSDSSGGAGEAGARPQAHE